MGRRYQRFFSVMKRLPPDWARFLATVDYRRRLALVAELDAAEARGIHRFRAHVLADKRRMLDLFTRLTHIRERHIESGVGTLLFERPAIEPPAHQG